jgi:hypothetical protein
MIAQEFIARWRSVELTERAAAQSHELNRERAASGR